MMKKKIFFITFLFLFLGFFKVAISQEKISLTITPPLIKVNFSPGQVWQSSVKVVNNNPYNLEVFVTVKDFKSGPEGGIVFIQDKKEEEKRFLLSDWIEFPQEPILIESFQSKNIPFTIKVPENAEPGGKYAAILIGTKPKEANSQTAIKITPLVSSLILANVRGDIKEAIWIREFSTDKSIYQKPKILFTLKIENIGNVHVQPQGEIKILNMYGKERGTISFNQKTEYGNILPQSSRKWTFSWEGEDSWFEFGKYRAILTLIYGSENKQTETREISFWILPLTPLILLSGSLIGFLLLVIILVRFYVKITLSKLIREVQVSPIQEKEKPLSQIPSSLSCRKISDIKISQPKMKIRRKIEFKIIFLASLISLLIVTIFALYLYNSLKERGNYKFETKPEKEFFSPESFFEKEVEIVSSPKTKEEFDKKSFRISILNGSGKRGLASEVAKRLEKDGFQIKKIGNAERFDFPNLNEYFKNKFEMQENDTQELTLIIGRDFVLENENE